MANDKLENTALRLLAAFERSGRIVSKVVIDGKKIEFVLDSDRERDEFDQIDMRHDKT